MKNYWFEDIMAIYNLKAKEGNFDGLHNHDNLNRCMDKTKNVHVLAEQIQFCGEEGTCQVLQGLFTCNIL